MWRPATGEKCLFSRQALDTDQGRKRAVRTPIRFSRVRVVIWQAWFTHGNLALNTSQILLKKMIFHEVYLESKLTWQWKSTFSNRKYIFKMGEFSIAMLVFTRGQTVEKSSSFNLACGGPINGFDGPMSCGLGFLLVALEPLLREKLPTENRRSIWKKHHAICLNISFETYTSKHSNTPSSGLPSELAVWISCTLASLLLKLKHCNVPNDPPENPP